MFYQPTPLSRPGGTNALAKGRAHSCCRKSASRTHVPFSWMLRLFVETGESGTRAREGQGAELQDSRLPRVLLPPWPPSLMSQWSDKEELVEPAEEAQKKVHRPPLQQPAEHPRATPHPCRNGAECQDRPPPLVGTAVTDLTGSGRGRWAQTGRCLEEPELLSGELPVTNAGFLFFKIYFSRNKGLQHSQSQPGSEFHSQDPWP